MKLILLLSFFTAYSSSSLGQKSSSHILPSGKYETIVKASKDKWTQGDIILLDDSKYKISSSNEIGEYKVSATAQRIFFISGPLQTVFAKAVINSDKPAILLPAAENEQQAIKISSDVVAYFRN